MEHRRADRLSILHQLLSRLTGRAAPEDRPAAVAAPLLQAPIATPDEIEKPAPARLQPPEAAPPAAPRPSPTARRLQLLQDLLRRLTGAASAR